MTHIKETTDGRKDLKCYYSKVVTCKLCRGKYGIDEPDEKNPKICPVCVYKIQRRN